LRGAFSWLAGSTGIGKIAQLYSEDGPPGVETHFMIGLLPLEQI
jgi:hypothetical protein